MMEEEKNKKEQQALMSHWRVKVQRPNHSISSNNTEGIKGNEGLLRRGSAPSSMQMRFKVDKRKSMHSAYNEEPNMFENPRSMLRYNPYIKRNSFPALLLRTSPEIAINSDIMQEDPNVKPRLRIQSCPQLPLNSKEICLPVEQLNESIKPIPFGDEQRRLNHVKNTRRMGLTENFLEEHKKLQPSLPSVQTILSDDSFSLQQPSTTPPRDPEINKLMARFFVFSENDSRGSISINEDRRASISMPNTEEQRVSLSISNNEDRSTSISIPNKEDRRTSISIPNNEDRRISISISKNEERRASISIPNNIERRTSIIHISTGISEERRGSVVIGCNEDRRASLSKIFDNEERRGSISLLGSEERKNSISFVNHDEMKLILNVSNAEKRASASIPSSNPEQPQSKQ